MAMCRGGGQCSPARSLLSTVLGRADVEKAARRTEGASSGKASVWSVVESEISESWSPTKKWGTQPDLGRVSSGGAKRRPRQEAAIRDQNWRVCQAFRAREAHQLDRTAPQMHTCRYVPSLPSMLRRGHQVSSIHIDHLRLRSTYQDQLLRSYYVCKTHRKRRASLPSAATGPGTRANHHRRNQER